MQVYNVYQTAAKLGIPRSVLDTNRKSGLVPEPHFRHGVAKLYTDAEIEHLRTLFKMPIHERRVAAGYLTVDHAARRLGVSVNTLTSRIAKGTFPAPTHPAGAKRCCYHVEELDALRLELVKQPIRRRGHKIAGHYNIAQAARRLRMPKITFSLWLKTGAVPRPTHQFEDAKMRFYNEDDLKSIQRVKRDYFIRRIKLL